MSSSHRYTLTFYVPNTDLEACKFALFAAGAGTYPGTDGQPGLYENCCFEIQGTGQFRPAAHANPHLGRPGEVERIDETKVEMLCVGTEVAKKAVRELRRVHPYEVVAYAVVKMEDF